MRYLIIFLFGYLFAYSGRVEPFNVYKISSSVSGEVKFVNLELEGKDVKNKTLIKIDDYQNRVDLLNLISKKKLLEDEIENLKKIIQIKKEIYESYKQLSTKSKIEKDLKFFDYINTKNQLINIKAQLGDIIANIDKLKDIISKKSVVVSGYVNKVFVKKGEFINVGRVIAEVDDISKEKIVLYVPIDKIDEIKNSRVFINSKSSNFKIYKIWKVPDSRFITSYRVELVGRGLKIGEIVQIDFKR